MKFADIAREVISMAREANAARLKDSGDDSPIVTSAFIQGATRSQPAEVTRLREFLEAQPVGVVYLLTATMYLGRGDFRARELGDQFADMGDMFGSPKLAARQMLETYPLPDYLEEGVKKLIRAGIDPDRLLTA